MGLNGRESAQKRPASRVEFMQVVARQLITLIRHDHEVFPLLRPTRLFSKLLNLIVFID
jgi:hypothetical protein